MRVILNLCLKDLKNIYREPMLLMSLIAPVLLIVIINLFVPWLAGFLNTSYQFNLVIYYNLIGSVFMTISPFIVGILGGLLILDEKEENIIIAYTVTPLGKNGYILYRLLLPGFFCMILMMIIVPFISIVNFSFLQMIPIVFISSLLAPIISLFMATFGSNKVEGLTLTKIIGIFIFFPVIRYFFHNAVTNSAKVLPNYWVCKSFLMVIDGDIRGYWIAVLCGTVLSVLILRLLCLKFVKML